MKDQPRSSFAPTILTIFGATGDLSANYLLPALYHMDTEGLLPSDFRLVCVGRRPFNKRSFLDFIAKKSKILKPLKKSKNRDRFLSHLSYYRGDFEQPLSFQKLKLLLDDRRGGKHRCHNRLYYFATSPEFFSPIAAILRGSGLLAACVRHQRSTRILVEKPFGFDYPSARKLNRELLRYFPEKQIYRIDHYLAKETVQNLMVVRFANAIFEPLWNKDFIDHVEISAFYDDRVGGRAAFYDRTGALRDVVQNHLLQILSLITMEEPRELLTEYIRNAKVRILRSLQKYKPSGVRGSVVRGQYRGYLREIGHSSAAETFVALKLFLNLPRWRGVPFYLRTGKGLSRKVTEVTVHFKELPRCLFAGCAGNVMVFRIQPDESVELRINNKVPGFGIRLHQAKLKFGYDSVFTKHIPSAYERLLLDFFQGDQRLFIRSDEIEAAWRFIDSVRRSWRKSPLFSYPAGSNGPTQASAMMERDGREWWTGVDKVVK
ncbi:MAG: glucose-6-phosphate dehydrogenase [Candidatus Doudnabacteria bacterium]|nr:glucose-6-phosphate dehydrogenase [Candidatus Doudnabacteria bacterium]